MAGCARIASDCVLFGPRDRHPLQRRDHHARELIEVLLTFATAQINAEARGIELGIHNAGALHGLLGGAYGEAGVAPLILPALRVFARVRASM